MGEECFRPGSRRAHTSPAMDRPLERMLRPADTLDVSRLDPSKPLRTGARRPPRLGGRLAGRSACPVHRSRRVRPARRIPSSALLACPTRRRVSSPDRACRSDHTTPGYRGCACCWARSTRSPDRGRGLQDPFASRGASRGSHHWQKRPHKSTRRTTWNRRLEDR